MILPALVSASNDPTLRGAPLEVYVWLLCNHLDVEEYRAVKIYGIARVMKLHRATASKALRRLVLRGYIERRHTGPGGYVYRLRLHRPSSAQAKVVSSSPKVT
jgi:predicted transcriptional regulator